MASNYYRKKPNYFRLYVLELEQGKYYVGLSHNVEKRFQMHKAGEGAEFTKLYKPLRIVKNVTTYATTYTIAGQYEDNETIKLMKIYGRENVRGGRYCAISQSVIDGLLGEEVCRSIDASSKPKSNGNSVKRGKKGQPGRYIDISKRHDYQIQFYENKKHVKNWKKMEVVHLLMNPKTHKIYAGRYDEQTNTIWISETIRNAYKGKGICTDG